VKTHPAQTLRSSAASAADRRARLGRSAPSRGPPGRATGRRAGQGQIARSMKRPASKRQPAAITLSKRVSTPASLTTLQQRGSRAGAAPPTPPPPGGRGDDPGGIVAVRSVTEITATAPRAGLGSVTALEKARNRGPAPQARRRQNRWLSALIESQTTAAAVRGGRPAKL